MANRFTQRKGRAMFGAASATTALVSYADAITATEVATTAQKNTIAANLETGETDVELGSIARTVALTFLGELASAGFPMRLVGIIEDNDGELKFEVVLSDAAISSSNPVHTGILIVDQVSMGGTVGDVRSQNRTYDVKAGTYFRGVHDRLAAVPTAVFGAEPIVTAQDATNAAKLAGLGYVASPTSAWTTGQKITIGSFDFNWTGAAWAAGAHA